jgi:DNA-binding beta-propeller fold protein YncE
LSYPADVDVDSEGNLYIADTFNSCVRKVDTSGIITTFAGLGGFDKSGYSGDGGPPAAAQLDRPYGIAFDAAENLYVIDTHNHRVRVIRK